MSEPNGIWKLAPCADCGKPEHCFVAYPTDKLWCTDCLNKRHPCLGLGKHEPKETK